MQKTNLAWIDTKKYFGPYFTCDEPSPKLPSHLTLIPHLGRYISCGLFGIGDDFIEKYQSLDSRFIRNKASTFFFEAAGDSMEPTIFAGEILVVDRSISTFHNRVCIVCYDGQMICKRVVQYKNHVVLKSDNESFKDTKVCNPDSLSYWGVVIARAGEVI